MPKKTISLYSWNVNGIRAVERKGALDWMHKGKPDIVCLQETKAHPEQLSEALLHPDGYESYWNSAIKKGYSGTVTYSRLSPILSETNFGDPFLDGEGRIVLTEYDAFFLFNVYFPNGGRSKDRLEFKMEFYKRFFKLIEAFRKKKPIVICGDVNTAHTEIDLSHPKQNEKTSGFMPIERAWLDHLFDHGYVDTFRHIHPNDIERYSWWDVKTRSRDRNIGWRIDYFIVSKELKSAIKNAEIHDKIMGSDHCPVSIELAI